VTGQDDTMGEESRLNNAAVCKLLETLADLLEIKGESSYKISAYRRAAATIQELGEDIGAVWEEGRLGDIPGVGPAIEKKLDEVFRSGHLELLDRLQAEIPAGVVDLLRIPGVGPKTARLIWERFGPITMQEVEQLGRQGTLQELPGLGPRSVARILDGISKLAGGAARSGNDAKDSDRPSK